MINSNLRISNNRTSRYNRNNINKQNNEGNTQLMLAIENGEIEVAKLLISKNANINIFNNDKQNALMIACGKGYYDIVELLVNNNANLFYVDNFGNNAFMYAIASNLGKSYKIVNYLSPLIIDIYIKNNNNDTPLILAIKTNYYKFYNFMNIFLDNNIINNKKKNYINIQNNDGETALIESVKKKDFELVKKLCDNGADINVTDNENNNLIILSSIENSFDENILEYFITKKSKKSNNFSRYINHKNNNGDNALISNCKSFPNLNILNILINNGININNVNNNGDNALSYAVISPFLDKKLDIIRLLIDKGIDINNVNNDGDNAFFYTIISPILNRKLDIVKLLIDKGININEINKDGNNALIIAIKFDYSEVVEYLLPIININIINNNNNSIINYIKSYKTFNIIKDYVDKNKNKNNKICKFIVNFIESYYKESEKHKLKKISNSKLIRQPSVKVQNQGNIGTCFAHAISRSILRLIKNYVPNYFINKNKENYIKINNLNDFELYLKSGEINLDVMYYNNILYYYFYYIIINKFGCNGADSEKVLSYILDTYININININNLNIMTKEHIDNISVILNEFYDLTKYINFTIKRYPYIQKYIPNEIKKILDKDLYVILSFSGNKIFFKKFSNIKSSKIDLKNFDYTNNNNQNIGRHSVVIKSYEENSMIITNSWGDNWGNSGYLKLDKNIFLNKSNILPYFLYIDIQKKKILKNNINKLPLKNLSLLYNNINENKYFINLNNNNCDKNNNENNNKKKEKDKKYVLNKMASIIQNNKK